MTVRAERGPHTFSLPMQMRDRSLDSRDSVTGGLQRQAHRVVGLVAVRAEPGAGGHGRAHVLQALAVAHAQARAAEAARRGAAARALRLACRSWVALVSAHCQLMPPVPS